MRPASSRGQSQCRHGIGPAVPHSGQKVWAQLPPNAEDVCETVDESVNTDPSSRVHLERWASQVAVASRFAGNIVIDVVGRIAEATRSNIVN